LGRPARAAVKERWPAAVRGANGGTIRTGQENSCFKALVLFYIISG